MSSSVLLRRRTGVSHEKSEEIRLGKPATQRMSSPGTLAVQIFILTVTAIVAIFFLIKIWQQSQYPILTFDSASDDEEAISKSRLPVETHVPEGFNERIVTCMPTISRNGIEYISNAVKSFRLATRNATEIRRLIVFDMNKRDSHHEWLPKVFIRHVNRKTLPNWLFIERRRNKVREPRRDTLGDSHERVVWRSKEADDYAYVLRRCKEMAGTPYISVVQDDVLFTSSFTKVSVWADEHIHEFFDSERRRKVCSGSLFDLAGKRPDGHLMRSSNMVARVYQSDSVEKLAQYIEANYDEAPVDWLADRKCKARRGVTVVMQPNGVRHRGGVSSFVGNKREGTLT